ncbi:hypothetical protein SMU3_04656, partial [Streptococcus mutans 11A1]
ADRNDLNLKRMLAANCCKADLKESNITSTFLIMTIVILLSYNFVTNSLKNRK